MPEKQVSQSNVGRKGSDWMCRGKSRGLPIHELTAKDGRNEEAQRGTKTRQQWSKQQYPC